MKIAMFGHKSIPSRAGGVEIVVEELSARMAALGHEVTCYNRRPAASQKSYRGIRLKTSASGCSAKLLISHSLAYTA